jgi:hypothetical protein
VPEKSNETILSSSTESSCDRHKLQDSKNTDDNAKCSDNSSLPTSPPPLLFVDTSLTPSSLNESNIKSDNSAVKQPLKKGQTCSTQDIDQLSMQEKEEPHCFNICEQKPSGRKLDEKHFDDSILDHHSHSILHLKLTSDQNPISEIEPTTFYQLPTAKTSSTFIGANNPSNEFELQPLSTFSASCTAVPEHSFPPAPLRHTSTYFSNQPSFSVSQDEYLHGIITRIGTDIDSDAYEPDKAASSVFTDNDRKDFVKIPQDIKGADRLTTADKDKLRPLQGSPHEKSAWSSTSSIATNPNTDNQSSMSKVITRFGASRQHPQEGTGEDYNVGSSQLQNNPTVMVAESSNIEKKRLSTSLESSNTGKKTDMKTFKSTAV